MITAADVHVMVDIETLGNDTRTGMLLSIGAVQFTVQQDILPPSTGEYAVATSGRTFYLPIALAGQGGYGLQTDAETVQWWLRDDVRCTYFTALCASQYSRPIKDVFEAFQAWIMSIYSVDKNATLSLWSHGVTYDCVHLAEKWPVIMEESFNRICPFRQCRDTRTLFAIYEAKHGKTPYPDGSKHHVMKHHPLYDAYVQAIATQTALRSLLTTS